MQNARLVNFKLNREGVRELLRSQEVMGVVRAEAMARCPDECEVDCRTGQNRVNARIKTATSKAYFRNLHKNTLLKAISS